LHIEQYIYRYYRYRMLFCIASFVALFASYAFSAPTTVDNLDVNAYMGHWVQVYGAPTNTLFQGYGECITADYWVQENGNVGVLNRQINEEGELDEIRGYAYYKNVSEPGKLTVHLEGVPTDSPYWVVKLGEMKENQYAYSIITTPSGVSLWVLVRDIDTFYAEYDKEVRKYLDDNKYRYVPIKQDNCENSAVSLETAMLRANYQSECQIASYLRKSGFPESSVATMVCISKYESSYNCDATHKNSDGSTDYGLMQINSYYWCSGDAMSKYNECKTTCSSLFNCQSNTNCAYIVWKQQGYNAWYAYKSHKTECDNYKINC